MDTKSNDKCPPESHTEERQREDTAAETGVMKSQPRDAGSHQKPGEARKDSRGPSEGCQSWPCQLPVQD